MHLPNEDRARVSAAVAAAELGTDGEIVTIMAHQSDGYSDVALHWAVLGTFLVGAVFAWQAPWVERLHLIAASGWQDRVPVSGLLTTLLLLMAAAFVLMRVALGSMAVRLALTPGFIETQRVRARALALFRTAAEQRTAGATGVLIYVSLAERRAELIADQAIHERVDPALWGAAMAALVAGMRDGRAADGLVAAIGQVGVVLAEHFPKSDGNPNELPDRLIEL